MRTGEAKVKVEKGTRAWWDFLGWAGTGKTDEEKKEDDKKLRGGFIPKETTTLLHAGEFVVDADTTTHIRDLLLNINSAGTKGEIINVIRSYAEYETGADESPVTVVLPTSMTNRSMILTAESEGIVLGESLSSGSGDSSMDLLYKG